MKRQHVTPVNLVIPKGIHRMEVLDDQKHMLIKEYVKKIPGLTISTAESMKACDIASSINNSGNDNVLILCQNQRINLISKEILGILNGKPKTVFLVGFKTGDDFLSIMCNLHFALGAVGHTFPMLARTYNGCTKRVS